jgi:hypothetical protein
LHASYYPNAYEIRRRLSREIRRREERAIRRERSGLWEVV